VDYFLPSRRLRNPRWWSHQDLHIEGYLPVPRGPVWSTWSSYNGLGASLGILEVSHLLIVVRRGRGWKDFSGLDCILCKPNPTISATVWVSLIDQNLYYPFRLFYLVNIISRENFLLGLFTCCCHTYIEIGSNVVAVCVISHITTTRPLKLIYIFWSAERYQKWIGIWMFSLLPSKSYSC
jgi:hypothetical protein